LYRRGSAGANVLLMECFRYLILHNGVVEILRGANGAPLRMTTRSLFQSRCIV
jgi:hypothetical protein